jgi:hypothetical protein
MIFVVEMTVSHTLGDNFLPDLDRIKSHVLVVSFDETLPDEVSERPTG